MRWLSKPKKASDTTPALTYKNEMKNTDALKYYQNIPIEKIVKATWNYKYDNSELKEKLKVNIAKNGQIENIIVRTIGDDLFEIVNGNHRYDAFIELGIKEVVCFNVGKISLAQAQQIAIETNETRFESDNTIRLLL